MFVIVGIFLFIITLLASLVMGVLRMFGVISISWWIIMAPILLLIAGVVFLVFPWLVILAAFAVM